MIAYLAGRAGGMPKDPATETLIEEGWPAAVEEAKGRDVEIYDGMLFRLNHLTVTHGKLRLGLGDTTYKEYVATRSEWFWRDRPHHELANPLALCIALGTAEGNIIMERRRGVDVYEGRYHVIGGFMERPHDMRNGIPDPFQGIAREVEEEVGLKIRTDTMGLTGVVYDLITPHPELCFCAESNLRNQEIADIFLDCRKDHEVEKLSFVDGSKDPLAAFIMSQHTVISVTGQACLLLYGRQKYGTTWFDTIMASLR